MIYFIKLKNLNYVKVGYTNRPTSRMNTYFTSLPRTLIEYVYIKEGNKTDEAEWHWRMRKYLIPGSEWAQEVPKKEIEKWLKEWKGSVNLMKETPVFAEPTKEQLKEASETAAMLFEKHKDEIMEKYSNSTATDFKIEYGELIGRPLWTLCENEALESYITSKKKGSCGFSVQF